MNTNVYEMDRTLDVPQKSRPASRKVSLAAGILYLLTFVSIPIGVLYMPVLNDPNYIVGSGPETRTRSGSPRRILPWSKVAICRSRSGYKEGSPFHDRRQSGGRVPPEQSGERCQFER